MQRLTRCSVLFGVLAGIWACSGDPTNNSGKPTLIVADPAVLFVAQGASAGVVVSVVDEDGQSLKATFDATQGAGITVTRDATFLPTQTIPPVDIGHQARFVPVRSDHDRHVTEPLCHQARFITGLLPV